MTKDAPAFDLYTADWLSGTLTMSYEEKGLYLDLLCLQWETGSLPDDAQLKRLRAKPAVLAAVLVKFPACEDGKRRNARLESERTKQRERIARKAFGAAKTNAKRWGKPVADESLSDHLASRERPESDIAKGSPSPPSPPPLIEIDTAHAREVFDEIARTIRLAYSGRRDAEMQVLQQISDDIARGQDPAEMLALVQRCATHIETGIGWSSAFVPFAFKFFAGQQWKSPDAFLERGKERARSGKPKATAHDIPPLQQPPAQPHTGPSPI